jgi:hypothetical protein
MRTGNGAQLVEVVADGDKGQHKEHVFVLGAAVAPQDGEHAVPELGLDGGMRLFRG